MQPLRDDPDNPPPEVKNAIAPHRLGPPDWPRRRTSIAVFSLRGDAFPTVVPLFLLLAVDIELNPGPNYYACRKPIRRGFDSLQWQVTSCTNGSHKQLSCSGFHRSHAWRCPPHGGPDSSHMAPTTSTICNSCQQPIRPGIRLLTCANPDCPRLVHSARRCSGLSARQRRWLSRQHRQPNRRSETVAGWPIAQIQQQEPNHPARRSCGNSKRTIACNIYPFTCSSGHTPFTAPTPV